MTRFSTHNLTRSAWLGVPVIGALGIALFLALPTGTVEQSVVYDIAGIVAVAGALLGVRLHRPDGWGPWVIMAIGQASFVIGDIIWTYFAAIGEDPFPSIADAAYLLGYPLLALGLGIAIRRRIRGGDGAGLLDGAILATGSVVVWWMFVLGPIAEASDPDPLSFAIGIAYPIGDLLLLGLALSLVMTPGAKSASFRLLVANLVVLLVGDLAYSLQTIDGTYVDGGTLDAIWLVGYSLFAMSAVHPTMAAVFDPRPVPVALLGRVRLGLLGGAMLVGPALLAIGHADGASIIAVVAVASAVLSVLVLVRLAGMVGHLSRDIERRAVLEAQLSYQAFHDPLTGLANRRRFIEAVGSSIASGKGTAVLFVDLDDFKHVNDGMGHDAGDALLSTVGQRLVSSIRPSDLACRIGGDEFAVLLPATPKVDEAEQVAERLLVALAQPVAIEGRDLVVPASIGVAAAVQGELLSVDELLRRADVAMYQAKAQGKNRLATFGPTLEVVSNSGQPAAASPVPRHARMPSSRSAASS